MDLKRQLTSFLRVPERVTLLFAGRADGTAAPVTPTDPLPVSFAPGAASDPDSAREVTLQEVRDLAGLIRDNTYLVAALANGTGLQVRQAEPAQVYPLQILGVGNSQALTIPEGTTHATVRVVAGSARLGLLDASVAPEVGPGGGMDDLRGALLTAFRVDVLSRQVRVDYWRAE